VIKSKNRIKPLLLILHVASDLQRRLLGIFSGKLAAKHPACVLADDALQIGAADLNAFRGE
jgi:hypothetical protein